MKTKHLIITLILLALVDDLISLAFPVNFQFEGYSFIPHLCLVGLLLNIYDKDWKDRILICAFCGLMTDFFFTDTFLLYFFLYGFLGYLSGIFARFMEADDRLVFFIVWMAVFLVDWIPFAFFHMNHSLHVGFLTWFIHHEALTISLHVIVIVFLMYCFLVFDRYEMIRMHRKKRFERRNFKKYKQEN